MFGISMFFFHLCLPRIITTIRANLLPVSQAPENEYAAVPYPKESPTLPCKKHVYCLMRNDVTWRGSMRVMLTIGRDDFKDDFEERIVGIILQRDFFHDSNGKDDKKEHEEVAHEKLLCLGTHCVVCRYLTSLYCCKQFAEQECQVREFQGLCMDGGKRTKLHTSRYLFASLASITHSNMNWCSCNIHHCCNKRRG